MDCLLCRLIYGPRKMAALKTWANAPWWTPNNAQTFFAVDDNQAVLRAAHKLRKSDPASSFPIFLNLAEDGSIWSMNCVADALLIGLGTPVDKPEAEKWFRRAHESGHELATLSLASEYYRQKRDREAEDLLAPLLEKDRSPALYLLGKAAFRAGDKTRARVLLEKASALGHRGAKGLLGSSCAIGKYGLRAIPYGFRLLGELGDEFDQTERDKVKALNNPEGEVVAQPSLAGSIRTSPPAAHPT